MPQIQLLVQGADGAQDLVTLDGITLESERRGSPAKLTFTVLKDATANFPEGAQVQLKVDGTGVFNGYVFQKSRDKEQRITCTAYDQLRYFKNKDTYLYTNKTASEVLQLVAKDFNLSLGTVEDTGYRIAQRIEDSQTLFDIVLNALDLTTANTSRLYILFDDFGKICLKNAANMKLDILVDKTTAENFDYSTSIDSDTYNQIKLVQENEEKGVREVYVARDNTNVGNWGILQYYDTVPEGANAQNMVNAYLKLKNRKTRNLTIKGILGDVRVRAGCSLPVVLDLGDIQLNKYLVCDHVTHHFSADHHSMDIKFYDANTFV